MKLHGFSSANWPKQSYESGTCAMTSEGTLPRRSSDWIRTRTGTTSHPWRMSIARSIHNAFVYSLARSMGYWAPKTQFKAEMSSTRRAVLLDFTSYSGITIVTDRLKNRTQPHQYLFTFARGRHRPECHRWVRPDRIDHLRPNVPLLHLDDKTNRRR